MLDQLYSYQYCEVVTINLIEGCWDGLKTQIPPSQASYQSGRSTTEQVFTLKILVEKAITSENYDIFILMLDMSKAFDTVNRSKLMQILQNILTPGELHMMYLLITDVILNVKIGSKIGKDILMHRIEIDPKYADDITYTRSLAAKINQVERLVPPMLDARC